MDLFKDREEYENHLKKSVIRSAANSIGRLLLIFFGLEIVLGILLSVIIELSGISLSDDADFLLFLENGLLSSVIFFFTALIYSLIKKLDFGELFPFEKIGGKRLFMLCTVGITVALMCNYAAILVTDVFGLFGIDNSGISMSESSRPSIVLYYLTVAILPAFVEEFAFRGVIMGSLKKYSQALALLVSSATFALMHGNFVQIPFTFCCGLVFGFLVLKTNSLLPSIIVHFLNNGLSVTFSLLVDYGIISEGMANVGYGIFIVAAGIPALFFIRKLVHDEPGFMQLQGADYLLPFHTKLKTAASSPTLISYAVIMMLYAIWVLIYPMVTV